MCVAHLEAVEEERDRAVIRDRPELVAAAQVWCAEATKEAERLQVQTDPHSPSKFRVMGPMVNHPGFAGTFSCQPGAPMNPAGKCEVW